MADLEEIKQMVKGGMSVTAIAEEVGLTPGRISQIVNAMGLSDSVQRKSVLNRLTSEQVEEIVQMYQQGDPVAMIIVKYGLNYNAFYKLLSDEGVEYRQRGPEQKKIRDKRMDIAIGLYRQGLNLYQIEIETGIRQPQLHRELHRRGVPLRRGRKLPPGFDSDLDIADDASEFDLEDLTDREREVLMPEDDF